MNQLSVGLAELGLGCIKAFNDDVEDAVIEGFTLGEFLGDEALTFPLLGEGTGTEMTVRVVAWSAKEGVAGK